MKNITTWVRAIIVIVLGFCLASCENNFHPVPEAEYSTKIVGHWQGTVGDLRQETDKRANLIQAQRDYFGAHTYECIDAKGTFHTEWQKG